MKTILYIISLFISLLILSCKSEPSNAERIKGEWVVTNAEGAFKELAMGIHYTFDDTNMSTQTYGSNDKISHPYVVKADTIFKTINGKDVRIPFSFEGDKLVFKFLNSEDKYILERKPKQ
jgi:hypothetical protein